MILIQTLIDFAASNELIVLSSTNTQEKITGANNIFDASESEITFVSNKYASNWKQIVAESNAGAIFIDKSLVEDEKIIAKGTVCISSDAKGSLVKFAKTYLVEKVDHTISELTTIHPSVVIGENVHLEPFSVIEEGVTIGNGSIIESHVKVGRNTQIGQDVHIKSSTVIGGSGFGYVKREDGSYEHLPHFGKVVIEDNVHIGSNTCIDRGSLSNTVIRKGVRIDNLVHIAHNVEIGENSLIIACSMIAGSVVIGKNVWVAPAATIRNAVVIEDRSTIGMGAVVTKNIKAEMTVLGNPAMTMEEYKQLRTAQKKMTGI